MRNVRRASWILLLLPVLARGDAPERGRVEATLQGKRIAIEYGRPQLYGRSLADLMAQLPEDRVWRAGSNDVTTLTSEGPFCVGGRQVAAGVYTVYVFAPQGGPWSLILNADPGVPLAVFSPGVGPSDAPRRWPHLEGYATGNPAMGLAPIAPREVLRAPMVRGEARPSLDRFTMSLTPGAGRVTLTLAWGETTWSVDLTE